jgi:hypothetical protein
MSLVTDLLERLAGVALLREKLNETAQRVERLGEWTLELDRRVTRLESSSAMPAPARKKTGKTKPKQP